MTFYSAIFGNDYSVIPVGSCIQVCQYTRAFNASTLFHNSEAIGIIDFDNRTSVEIEKLKAEKYMLLIIMKLKCFYVMKQ